MPKTDKSEQRSTKKSKKRNNKSFPYKKTRGANILYNEILVRSSTKGNSKIQCEKCEMVKRIKFMAKYKGKILCSNCRPNMFY